MASGLAASRLGAQEPAPLKIAFVVGVSRYHKEGFADLRFAENDAQDLATTLARHGFQVTKVVGREAKLSVLKEKLTAFFKDARELGKDDIVLLSFSGHGQQLLEMQNDRPVEAPFYCPYDALKSDTDTLLSLNWVIEQLTSSSGSGQNLLLVDACRDNPAKGVKGVDGSKVTNLPSKVSLFFSSSAGQPSYESDKVGHGIFTHFLLDGLSGKAADSSGHVTWLTLVSHVMEQVKQQTPVLLESPSAKQLPNFVNNLEKQPVLASFDRATKRPSQRPELLTAPFGETQARAAQRDWAAYLGKTVELTNGLGMKFQLIPPGKFTMGSASVKARKDQRPHLVTLTRPFYAGVHEVTRGNFQRFVDETGYRTRRESVLDAEGRGWDDARARFTGGDFNWKRPGWQQAADHPVVNVTWNDCQAFLTWLGNREGYRYRLLTEAEWEYCCRAGTDTLYYVGDDPRLLTKVGNVLDRTGINKFSTNPEFVKDNQDDQVDAVDGFEFTSPVGSFRPNAFGLFDFHGNVCEWCNDYYDAGYGHGADKDPQGALTGDHRCARGGRFDSGQYLSMSFARNHGAPTMADMILGLRVATEGP